MPSVYDEIRAALEVQLASIAGLPPIAYENVSYSPTTGVSFIQPKFIPVSRRPAVRGLNPQQRYDGVFRVFCYTPEGQGPAAADAIADKVIEAFEATTSLPQVGSGGILSIDYAERDSGSINHPWYYVAVNIGWYLYR